MNISEQTLKKAYEYYKAAMVTSSSHEAAIVETMRVYGLTVSQERELKKYIDAQEDEFEDFDFNGPIEESKPMTKMRWVAGERS